MIEVTNLSRAYGEFLAVEDVSFYIPRGQIVGLLGHNGAGKTTIMKVLTGYLEPTSGVVSIGGLDVVGDRLAVQRRMGYLPEHSPLYPEMLVVEYLDYVCDLRDIPPAERREALQRVISKTGLQEKVLDRISTLSKGYLQRVGVAQAIIHRPEILILDEATSGLDPVQIQGMRSLIKELSQEATVILSTHIMQEVEALCDRVIIIARGRVAADAALADLQSSNRLLLECSGGSIAALAAAGSGVKLLTETAAGDRTTVLLEVDNEEAGAQLARRIVEQGRSLYHVGREERSLDTVFREIETKVVQGGAHVG